ncbi:hypothetical protein Tco_0370993 [Tanacetum coccineum]
MNQHPDTNTYTSGAPVNEPGPSLDPNIASSSRPHEFAPDQFTSTNVEDETMGGSFQTSPPRSGILKESELTHIKLLFMEGSRKVVKKEEDAEQDVDPLIKLAKAAAIAATASAIPTGGSHAADIPPSSYIHFGKSRQRVGRERKMQRKRQQDVLNSAKYYTDSDWTDIMGQVHANQGLTADLLGPDVNEYNFAERMVALIAKRRREFAAQRKHVKVIIDDQLKTEFDKIRAAIAELDIFFFKHQLRSLKRPVPSQKVTIEEVEVPSNTASTTQTLAPLTKQGWYREEAIRSKRCSSFSLYHSIEDGGVSCGDLVADSKFMNVAFGVGFKMLLFNPLVLSTKDLSRVNVLAGRYVVPTGKDKIILLVAFRHLRDAFSVVFGLSLTQDTVMSDSEDSTVTYTVVSSPFADLPDIRSPRVDGPLVMPENSYAYVVAAFQAPPSPDYVMGPEYPPSPKFVPEPVYPEFMPLEDEILPAEEQPLPAAILPTADSPDYIPELDPKEDPEEDDDEDPKEDPADYLVDRGDDGDDEDESSDDDEDEEALSAEETDPFEIDESLATPPPHPAYHVSARISIKDETPISLPPREEVERLLVMPTPPSSLLSPWLSPLPQIPSLLLPPILSPLPVSLLLPQISSPPLPVSSPVLALSPPPPASPLRPLGYRVAMIRLRAEAASISHSLPLPPPIILSHTRPDSPSSGTPPLHLLFDDRRADRPEVTLPKLIHRI